MPRSMLFESGFAARKRLGNPIEGCVDANSAMCLINFSVEAVGHCVHSDRCFCEGDPASWAFRRIATLANSSTITSREPVLTGSHFQESSEVSSSWSMNGDSKTIGFRTSAPVCIASILWRAACIRLIITGAMRLSSS